MRKKDNKIRFDTAVIDVATYGSTGKIATNICKALTDKGEITCFCYGTGKKPDVKVSYKIDLNIERYFHVLMCRLLGYQGFFSIFATIRLISFLKRNEVRKIYALQLHGYYLNESLFFSYIKKNNISLVYIMIDEYPLYGKCGYRANCEQFKNECKKCLSKKDYPSSLIWDRAHAMFVHKKKAYSNLEKACFVGPEYLINEAKKSPLTQNVNMQIVDEAIDTDFYIPSNTDDLRKLLKIEESKVVILCVAPYGKGYERKI